jgi:hypothetical protein
MRELEARSENKINWTQVIKREASELEISCQATREKDNA